MTTHKLILVIITLMILIAALPQAVLAQLIIDRITVKEKADEQGRIIGMQISYHTNLPATTRIDYGTTVDYGFFNGTSLSNTYHEVVLSGLKSNTTYNYQITAFGGGYTVSTINYTFRTGKVLQPKYNNASITDIKVTHVGGTYFIVTWKADESMTGQIRYNIVENFTKPAVAKSTRFGNQFEAVVPNLKVNTKYYWQIYVYDSNGNSGTSSVQTVTTGSSNTHNTPIFISEISPLSQTDYYVTDTTAVVRWRTNLPAKGIVDMRSTVRGVQGGGKINTKLFSTSHEVTYTKLVPNTNYVFTINITDVHGKRTTTGQLGFTTKPKIESAPAPQVAGVSVECFQASWTYQHCRNLNEERARAVELKNYLNQVYKNNVPAAALRNWYTLVNAYTYGGYPKEAIFKAVKHGGKTVHPTIPYSAWQNSKDYKDYINK